MDLRPAGDRAILVELGEVTAEELHAANAAALAVPGVVRAIPGHSSLYVIFAGAPDREPLERALARLNAEVGSDPRSAFDGSLSRSSLNADRGSDPTSAFKRVERVIPVSFDGEDFEEFLPRAPDFFQRIGDVRLIARYLGFRGGFAYLDGWPEEWAMPRRPTSRPVRRGSFAIAGNVAAFYPIDTPGGWNILGHTDVDLENAIAPGDVFRIRVERGLRHPSPPERRSTALDARIERITAPLAVFTDRPFDDVAAAIANAAVGNDDAAPVLECPLAGPKVRFTRDAFVAWCTPQLDVSVERVRAGDERAFGRVIGGLRGYLAVGDREGVVAKFERSDRLRIRAMRGPHETSIGTTECEVTPQLDRVGIRLRPLQPLRVEAPASMRSVGMQCGTVQLHPDGSMVAMGPDHPVTGGYLQPLTVLAEERWKLAQLVPGERVSFVAE
jgi:allophanate hydrolase subunit 1